MKTPPNEVMVRRYRAGLGKVAAGMILLLTTTGRKSGNKHTVAVQYEKIDGRYFIGAGKGQRCDWYRNIQADPRVTIEVGSKMMEGKAEVVSGTEKVADFLEYRLRRHPLVVGIILKMDGCSFRPKRKELLKYAEGVGAVVITPEA